MYDAAAVTNAKCKKIVNLIITFGHHIAVPHTAQHRQKTTNTVVILWMLPERVRRYIVGFNCPLTHKQDDMLFSPFAEKRFLSALSHIQNGSIRVTMPDGRVYDFGDEHAPAELRGDITIHDMRTVTMLASAGDRGFAESYRDGYWDSTEPEVLLAVALSNEHCLDDHIYGSMLPRVLSAFNYIFKRNSQKGSKRNIGAHYDLGNDFYRLWLDESMTYSSALYRSDADDLTVAQEQKYDRILSRLHSDSGSLLEIGCGWGGFAARAQAQGDFSAKGITLSEQQYAYVAERAGQNYRPALEDYRIQTGAYDHIVSIEMFEAVGERYWPVYFGKIKELLAKNGRAVIQTITIGEPYFEKYKRSGDAIRSFIFPGGMLPTKSGFAASAAAKGLRTEDQFAFGMDYSKTLNIWRRRFDAVLPQLNAMGYDTKFARMWRFYLAASSAGFRTGRIDVMQTELRHAT